MTPSRAQLRQHFKQRRRAISDDARAVAIAAIRRHLSAHFEQHAQPGSLPTVGAFMATAEEVDLRPWLVSFLTRGGRVALPRITDGNTMTFHEYTATTALQINRYGIDEPAQTNPIVAPADMDVVLVPLLAFDRTGTRLGMGGGYYDRYLPNLRTDATTLGVAFTCQQSADPLPCDSWDVPLHAVVTENGVLKLR